MNYRNAKLTAIARDQPCMVAIPECCDGGGPTSVWAHSNLQEHGKGTGIKAHDPFGAIACGPCHDALDGRSKVLPTREARAWWMRRAMDRTLLYLFQQEKLKVAR
ncbi:MAG: nuclease domain-containing protein [Gammaproteobacteria bacterium]